MKIKWIIPIMMLVVGSLIISCSKIPQQEIDAAKAAVENAKLMAADQYLPEMFKDLQESLNNALVEVEEQNSKFFISKNYNNAKTLLQAIVTKADEVSAKASLEKEAVRMNVQSTLAELKTLLQENKELIIKAPKGKGERAALEMIENDLSVIDVSINEIAILVNNGDFLSARSKLNAGLTKAQSINEELKNAISKKSRIVRETKS